MTACPHCGEPISNPDVSCPACGAPPALVIEEQTERIEPKPAAEEPAEHAAEMEETPAEEPQAEEAPAEKPQVEETPAEDTPAEETPAEETPAEETPAPDPEEENRSFFRRLRDRWENREPLRAPAFLTDPEAWRRLTRFLAILFTTIGLLALLALALMLIQANRLSRDARALKEDDNVPLPARPEMINYSTPAKEERARSEGAVRYIEDELIAVSGKGISYTDMERFFGQRDIRIVGYVEWTDTYQLRLPEAMDLAGLTETARALESEAEVDCAAVSVVWEPVGCTVPDDPWDEEADWEEFSPDSPNWGLLAIRAPESWDRFPLGAVKVGLIDSAFDSAQEDLRFAAIRGNGAFFGRSQEETKLRQHGTAVAAVVGAIHDNGRGLSGVVKECRIYAEGSPRLCGQMDAISALADLAARDVSVIQYGLGWPEELAAQLGESASPAGRYYGSEPARLAGLALERLLDKGCDYLLVVPAGNSPEGERLDASCGCLFSAVSAERVRRRILVVGAAGPDPDGGFAAAEFSNGGPRVDLLAPGVEIHTALAEGQYARRSGTSLAAAHVTGVCAAAWTLSPGLSGAQLRDLVIENAGTAVSGSGAGLLDMAAVLEAAPAAADARSAPSSREQALDAYAALLRRGVPLRLRGPFGFSWAQAEYYYLLDMDGDGVEELLLYALNENELSASFALYGYKNGELLSLADAWNSCRFSSWSNARLSLEVWDDRYLYAGAEKSSAGYGETGDSFSVGYFGKLLYCMDRDLRPEKGERLALIENTALTEEGVRIGSARDIFRDR